MVLRWKFLVDNCTGDFIEQDDEGLEDLLDVDVICEPNRITIR